jgi:hypothetical protein
MRNRELHDALREFALEAAALLTEDARADEVEFEVEEDRARRGGPALYRYRPLTEKYLRERWSRLRELPSCPPAADALGAGAASWLRVNGLGGAQAEPALQAMLERLYEDATSFGFPEERFERVYREVEQTLYRDTVPSSVVAPLPGLELESERVDLGEGLALAAQALHGAPVESQAVCVLERDCSPDDPFPEEEARERFRALVTGLRLFKAGGVTLGGAGWRRAGDSRWNPVELDAAGDARGEPWTLYEDEEEDLSAFLDAVERAAVTGPVAWALNRFEMGCGRGSEAEALSDYLMALRGLLDATGEAGEASLALRLAALCAEEGERRTLRRRVEQAVSLERFVMGGARGKPLDEWIGPESPRALVAEIERHTRALLRDVICGYLDADLKGVADEILLERPEPPAAPRRPPEPAEPEQMEIEARDLREERDTTEIEAVEVEPPEAEPVRRSGAPEGVTPSADWDDYSAPV